jgi:hypothetical protein
MSCTKILASFGPRSCVRYDRQNRTRSEREWLGFELSLAFPAIPAVGVYVRTKLFLGEALAIRIKPTRLCRPAGQDRHRDTAKSWGRGAAA